jgi:hypothetical protein
MGGAVTEEGQRSIGFEYAECLSCKVRLHRQIGIPEAPWHIIGHGPS